MHVLEADEHMDGLSLITQHLGLCLGLELKLAQSLSW